ncbi:hypothetical protein [Streptomyces griseorubiginosus]|uniref:hypothetical protein n=1 Tax=Streptomyces griseorubiginosus TaxID=67304 RepID=UPI002E80B459|nr:hypothetical protein [Streptomyces griseorubiginosus]WUB50231.1 hypothetical protein OHN19_18745 [Streptomyces griseorubiginosus]WUB58756.1 hypothetical protein OG942_18740 [Streptomyces griseorubiginosus]
MTRWTSGGRCAVTLATLLTVTLSGCGSTPAYVTLERARTHGVAWQVDAWEQQGKLCIFVDGPKGPKTAVSWSSGGCGFDNTPGSAYFVNGWTPGAGDMDLAFGPLPADATQVRVATREVIASKPLPSDAGLPHGRYWLFVWPSGWPNKADGKQVGPTPLNASGKPVAFTKF